MLKDEVSTGNLPESRAAAPAWLGLKVTEGGWSWLRNSMKSWKRESKSRESERDTSGEAIVGGRSGWTTYVLCLGCYIAHSASEARVSRFRSDQGRL